MSVIEMPVLPPEGSPLLAVLEMIGKVIEDTEGEYSSLQAGMFIGVLDGGEVTVRYCDNMSASDAIVACTAITFRNASYLEYPDE